MSERKSILLLALAVDLLLGDPPNRFHPVAWMGNLIASLKRHRPYGNPRKELAYGAGILALGGGGDRGHGVVLGKAAYQTPQTHAWSGRSHDPQIYVRTAEPGIQVRDCASFGLPEYIRLATRMPGEHEQLLSRIKALKL